MMEFKQEETDEVAAAEKTLESKEEISKGDVEKQTTYQGEMNHTHRRETTIERSEQTIIVFRNKNRAKRQEEIQRMLEDFKGIKNISGIKSAKRRVFITKKKDEKSEVITSRKGIFNVFGEFCKKFCDDQEHEETERENEENENESSIDVQHEDTSEMMRTTEIATGVANCNQQSQKKANLQTATESEPKTSKHATMRRKKW